MFKEKKWNNNWGEYLFQTKEGLCVVDNEEDSGQQNHIVAEGIMGLNEGQNEEDNVRMKKWEHSDSENVRECVYPWIFQGALHLISFFFFFSNRGSAFVHTRSGSGHRSRVGLRL